MKKKILAGALIMACVAMVGCGKDEIQESAGALKAGELKVAVDFGAEVSQDLDGDGSLDVIKSSLEIVDYIPEITMAINGTDVSGVVDGDEIFWTDSIERVYYLVDLDTSDKFVEIAIGDYGMSDDPVTCFFRYDGNQLKYMGEIYDIFDNGTMKILGNGIVEATMLQSMIETRKTFVDYEVSDGKLVLVEQEWYEPDYSYVDDEWKMHSILQDVTVYTENDVNSEKVVLKEGSGKVSFPANDDKEWVQVQTEDGQIYYLHIVDLLLCESDGEEIFVYEIFENLAIAG